MLVNHPNSPQSVIYGAQVLDLRGRDQDITLLSAANEALGGGFLARINMNLREAKGWSYGAGSGVGNAFDRVYYGVRAPVQSDRTGDSISEIRKEINEFVDARGVQPNELERIVNSNMRELPGQFETAGDVLGGLVNIVRYNRPDNYYETRAQFFSKLTAAELDAEARRNLDEGDMVYIVVGDAKVVEPQLENLGLKVEVIEPQE